MNKLPLALLAIIAISGCSSNQELATQPEAKRSQLQSANYYSLDYPISLPASTTSSMHKDQSQLGFDRDLLALPSSTSKMYTKQLTQSASIGSTGLFGLGGEKKHYRTIYDTIQYASYPLSLTVPINNADNCLQKAPASCEQRKINILPLIGAGVRVTADYYTAKANGSLSLTALDAAASASELEGTLQLQLIGINRLGANAAGFTQLDLTPDSIAMIQQQIGSMMSQMWIKDTIIQPQITGYTILGNPDLSKVSQTDIVDQMLAHSNTLSDNFFEAILKESIRIGDVALTEVDDLRHQYELEKVMANNMEEKAVIAQLIRYRLADRTALTPTQRRLALEHAIKNVPTTVANISFDDLPKLIQDAVNYAKARPTSQVEAQVADASDTE
ncbi:hypothetical protein [Ferrimonas aestuarii]|uniref:Uncharacterized protein n=1 Tax=Ferrimonas aestuarii TaxID=2569539 RepID=A0A4U1BMG8_9GAMM|nr:hypothetical protein [Ferrimonas aestuarii]TKB54480.1 hypothetical protein FCL42_11755 [Ferrimonas aestuarii]